MSSNLTDVMGSNLVVEMFHRPNFHMSHTVRDKHIAIVDRINEEMGTKPYVVYTRAADVLPQARYTIGAGRLGLPELVVMGNTSSGYVEEVFKAAHAAFDELDMHDRIFMRVGDYADYLNTGLEANPLLKGLYRFVPVDTDQFMYGVGLNCRRWYGHVHESAMVVQMLYAIEGKFPDDAGYPHHIIDQPILQQMPFGYRHLATRPLARPLSDLH